MKPAAVNESCCSATLKLSLLHCFHRFSLKRAMRQIRKTGEEEEADEICCVSHFQDVSLLK